MNTTLLNDKKTEKEFESFVQKQHLSDEQAEQFNKYGDLLLTWNKKFNLTTITDSSDIITYHFLDSIMIKNYFDFTTSTSMADVGTGAGFPGLALKICFPKLMVYLLEVNQKKVSFLAEVIEQLGLTHIEIIECDWRTYLRKTESPVDLFCARASLSTSELLRIFKPVSPFKDATLVYWAADSWQPDVKEEPFIDKQIPYTLKSKQRKYVFFKNK